MTRQDADAANRPFDRDEAARHIQEHSLGEAARIGRLSRIREFVLGAQDGLLVPLGVVTGMATTTSSYPFGSFLSVLLGRPARRLITTISVMHLDFEVVAESPSATPRRRISPTSACRGAITRANSCGRVSIRWSLEKVSPD